MPDDTKKATGGEKGMPARNKFFASDKRAKGLEMGGIKSKNPCEAIGEEGAHETPPQRENNTLKEDIGS